MDIEGFLDFAVKNKASDLHLSAGLPPMYRVDGDLRLFENPILEHKDVAAMIDAVMNDMQRREYKEHLETDFSFQSKQLARFRVNAFTQERGAAAVFRIIPMEIVSMEALHLPPVFTEIASYPHGLVLVTGPTGSGKSTTLAAIIDYININRHQHIITIEDPIEFVHCSKNCLVNQREVFRDTHSFSAALRSSLRQDPDIILVGELRDLETIRLAMTAAETGHLVFATLHTSSASKTINRIIDVFPGEEKSMIRSMLSGSLQAVLAQTLLKKKGGGRIAALEIMLCNTAIRSLIREDKVAQMYSTIQTGKSLGMQTLDQHLTQLVHDNLITRETAREVAMSKDSF
ncbi:MAG: twitching motility protein PilT [Legionellales bacterium RIFCSPHIGHO2_12_FULL_42_9]|nr:MAG: twitching motility protein PilT [Legionellales bacterium RIFCSPHIGHO2_12_FULL_42_9]